MPAKQTPPTDKQRKEVYIKALDYMLMNIRSCEGWSTLSPYPAGLCPLIGMKVLGLSTKSDSSDEYNKTIASYCNPLKKYATNDPREIFWFNTREERMEALAKEIKLLSRSWLQKLIDKIKVAVIRDYNRG